MRTVTSAYGRTYHNADTMIAAWLRGDDFMHAGEMTNCYCLPSGYIALEIGDMRVEFMHLKAKTY